jgi:hypothetical protein
LWEQGFIGFPDKGGRLKFDKLQALQPHAFCGRVDFTLWVLDYGF